MGMSTMENGKTTRPMAMDSYFVKMVGDMKECGFKINKKVLEKKFCLMGISTRGTSRMD